MPSIPWKKIGIGLGAGAGALALGGVGAMAVRSLAARGGSMAGQSLSALARRPTMTMTRGRDGVFRRPGRRRRTMYMSKGRLYMSYSAADVKHAMQARYGPRHKKKARR